ncbi:MAG: hypothetical protein ABJF05_14785 [Paracoccaceae bacterium]
MRTLSLTYNPVILAALIGVAAYSSAFADEPEVVDPTTGETIAISEIDFDTLSDDDRADIGDQLAEQGISPRGGSRTDLSEVEVVDPTTGETVSLADIDHDSLSDEDRTDIGDQLAEQGVSAGRGGDRGASDTSTSEDAGAGRSGRGGKSRGGPRN